VRWLGVAAATGSFAVTPVATGQSGLPVIINPNDPRTLDVNEAFDGSTWTTKASMPTPRSDFSISEAGGSIYTFGGAPNIVLSLCTPLDVVEAYNPATDSWSPKASMPMPARWVTAAATVNGLIYVIGGQTGCGGNVATVEAYNPATNIWTTGLPSMSHGRYYLEAAVVKSANHPDGIIYAIGGNDNGPIGALPYLEAFDPAANNGAGSWTSKPDMPTARFNSVAAVVGGKIYVIGGQAPNNPGQITTVVEAFDPNGNNGAGSWTTGLPPMPTRRAGCAGAVINNIIYVVGGSAINPNDPSGSIQTAAVEAFDPNGNNGAGSWTTVSPMPTARGGHRAAFVDNTSTLYAVGGFLNAQAFVSQEFTYQIIATQHPTSYSASTLPPGLSIDSATGLIFGTPTSAVPNTDVQVTATKNGVGSTTKTLHFTVAPALPQGPLIVSSTCATGRTGPGHPFTFQVLATNTTSSAVFTAGGLPPGLSIDGATGLISGTATSDGTFIGALGVTDGPATTQARLQLSFTSDPTVPIITSSENAFLTSNQFFSFTLTADASGNFSYIGTDGVKNGALPPGLHFDGVATISGTYTGGSGSSGVMTREDRATTQLTGGRRAIRDGKVAAGRKAGGSRTVVRSPVIQPDTLTIRPPRISSAQPVANNSNGTGTSPLNFFQATTFASWEQNYFTQAQLNDPTVSCDSCDPDHDGLSNLLEYAFNLDPTTPSTTNRPYSALDATYFSFIYTKSHAATDLTCTIEESTNLIQWSPVTPVNQILADDGFTQTVKAQVPKSDAGSGGKLYLRLRVSR
jgi:N-acetylneuraminic acid mutarotase